jgi:hypothetical protein
LRCFTPQPAAALLQEMANGWIGFKADGHLIRFLRRIHIAQLRQ